MRYEAELVPANGKCVSQQAINQAENKLFAEQYRKRGKEKRAAGERHKKRILRAMKCASI
jgi:hypothetical protein